MSGLGFGMRARTAAALALAAVISVACAAGTPGGGGPAAKLIERDPDAILKLSATANFVVLDPIVRRQVVEDHMVLQIYDTLIFRDQEYKLLPGLATEWKSDATTNTMQM